MNEFAKRVGVLFFGETKPGCCVICKKEVNVDTDFKDLLSAREWTITQLCQKCQDDSFSEPDDEDDFVELRMEVEFDPGKVWHGKISLPDPDKDR